MMLTIEAKRKAVQHLRDLQFRVFRDRQNLIDLLVNARDNQGHNLDLNHIQAALDRLEGLSGALNAFMESQTGKNWEGK